MFENYNKLYKNFIEYIKKINSSLNLDEMEGTFINDEMLILEVYDKIFKKKYEAFFSEEKKKMIFLDPSIQGGKLKEELKLELLVDYMKTEFSYTDTLNNVENYIPFGENAYILTDYGMLKLLGRFTFSDEKYYRKVTSAVIYTDSEENKNKIEEFFNQILVEIPKDVNSQKNLTVCTSGSYGIKQSKIKVKPFDCDIKKNYNDDLPYERFTELINSEKEELILMHGDPGTGKTSIIKKLIHDNPQTEFIYFDFNLLTTFSDSKIFEFLSEHKNHVFIIEDCEKLFTDRNNGNRFLNTMLNLTDGIIGEAFGIKFLCTFNCPTNQIDKAVMREGRLSLIYEFKKLTLEKTKEHIPSATSPMTLAQIYNQKDNGTHKTQKIGF